MTKILKIDPENIDEKLIKEAAEVIKKEGLVAFPTETVYGLGADAFSPKAVVKIFEVKKRPRDNPLIVHICNIDQLFDVAFPNDRALELAEKFWPGPLTLVLPKKEKVPKEVTANLNTVCVRMPTHPVALKLIEYSNPIAAPSANLSGKPSPTTAEHVIKDLFGLVDVIIDSGETIYGLESTIIDLTSEKPRILRAGALPIEEVEKVLGEIEIPNFARGLKSLDKALSPGVKYKHYAPEADMILVEGEFKKMVERIKEIALEYLRKGYRVGILCTDETINLYPKEYVKLSLGSRKNLFIIARKFIQKTERV